MKVIYVDVLFLFNFAVDHLLLDLTSYLRGNARKEWRLVLASSFGGLAAILFFMMPDIPLASLACKTASCGLMTAIAFGQRYPRRFAGDCVTLFVVSMIFCGGIAALSQVFPGSGTVKNTAVYMNISSGVLVGGIAISYLLLLRMSGSGGFKEEKELKRITCVLRGAELSFNAFVDTGNMLFDPARGKKVIMISLSLIVPALPEEDGRLIDGLGTGAPPSDIFEALAVKAPSVYGLTPFTSAGGSGLILTIRPDSLTIDGVGCDEYILGVSGHEIETAGGCRALIGCR